MFPFIYFIDCEGNLWVPCDCKCNGGNGNGVGVEVVYVNGRREYRERRDYCCERREPCCYDRDSCVKRDYECIRPASESEKIAYRREQDLEKILADALKTVERLEKLNGRSLTCDP